jgi:gamma-glutamyltranspeptidase/glutathione hydrolase
MQREYFLLLVCFALCFIFCSREKNKEIRGNTADEPAVGRYGMVSSAHPIATEAGLEILKKGGNAFDAAVAVAAVLNVVEPMMSGIGGYGTIVIYDARKKEARYLNSSGRIPKNLDSDVFRPPTPDYLQNRTGAKAISTPGNVNAWEAMSKEYGKLPWKDLFNPAIKAAEKGFILDERTASSIRSAYSRFPENAKVIYGKNGESLKAGDQLIQKDLAQSFKMIAHQGAKAIYGGELGKAIDQTMRESGGFLTIDDLIADHAEWWKPISINYRGYEVVTASPPSNAFPSLIRLGIMSRFDNRALGHNTTAYLHRFAEVTKHGYWCRLAYAGDPDFSPPPLDKLLSDKYWDEQASKINLKHATDFVPPGISETQGKHTTHFVVADKWGNVVSATQTLGNLFGSRILVEGTGIWLNNSLAYCTFEPKGNPMDAYAGHRKLSGDCPTLIMRDGKLWVAIGTPGGHTIDQTVPQMVMNIIDFGMDIQKAIAAPRISFTEPNTLTVEAGIPESIRKELEALGHKIRIGGLGDAHGLAIEYDSQGVPMRFTGGADPRSGGLAKGF